MTAKKTDSKKRIQRKPRTVTPTTAPKPPAMAVSQEQANNAVRTLIEYTTERKFDLKTFGGAKGAFGRMTPVVLVAVGRDAIAVTLDHKQKMDQELNALILGL